MRFKKKRPNQLTKRDINNLLELRKPQKVIITDYKHAVFCPRCNCPIDRDFLQFCSHCGQRLNWSNFK